MMKAKKKKTHQVPVPKGIDACILSTLNLTPTAGAMPVFRLREWFSKSYSCLKIHNFYTNEDNFIQYNTHAVTAYIFISVFVNVTISVVLIA